MAVKRTKKTPSKVAKAYEQAMAAEGAPVALDLLGFGSTIGDLIRGKSPKRAVKKRVKKKARPKPKTTTAKKKRASTKSRRRR